MYGSLENHVVYQEEEGRMATIIGDGRDMRGPSIDWFGLGQDYVMCSVRSIDPSQYDQTEYLSGVEVCTRLTCC